VIIPLPAADDAEAALGRQLRRVREARGFSLDRLGEEARLARLRLALAEQGRTRLTAAELHAIISALRIPLGLLYAPEADLAKLRRL
jgi:transcriptional regulator with XRE-family HTH domain